MTAPAGDASKSELQFRRLKRAASIGNMTIMVWICLAGGYLLLRSGDGFGWVAMVIGSLLLGSPFIPFFRWYWRPDNAPRAYAYMIMVASIAMIALTGSIASIYLRDPFLIYNDLDTLMAIVFGVATALSALTLAANATALVLDLRAR